VADDDGHGGDGAAAAPRARRPAAAALAAADGVPGGQPLRAAVDAVFRNEQVVANAFKENLKERTLASEAIARRAEKAFENFSPSGYSKEERAERTYLAPTDDLPKTLAAVAKDGARALKQADKNRGIRLTRNAALERLLEDKRSERAATIGTISHVDLVEYVLDRLGTTPAPVASARLAATATCSVDDEVEQRLGEIENGQPAAHEADTEEEIDAGGADGDAPEAHAGDHELTTDEVVKAKVTLLMDTVVSPEKPIRIDPPEHPVDAKVIQSSIKTFELRDGPADVTSYHDFNSLQIAFRHVWTEVFDTEIEALGKELYQEYVKLKDFSGLDTGKDAPISTVEDLARLIAEVKELSTLTQGELPGGSASGRDGSGRGPAGAGDLRDDPLYQALTGSFIGNDAAQAVLNPVGFGIDLLANIFAGTQQITWALLEDGRIPGGIDVVTATFEQNAVSAGTVEIVLTTSADAGTWKGIDFTELDTSGRPVDVRKISNHPQDTNRMRLSTQRVKNGVLTFGKEITFGIHKAHYFLTDLDEKLKGRTRVTFNWQKDK
jgi:hypothetical protein